MRKNWTDSELEKLMPHAHAIYHGIRSYYKACKELTRTLDRSWESVRSRLKRIVYPWKNQV